MGAARIPAIEPDSAVRGTAQGESGHDTYEPIPLDAILDSEPDPEWEVVDVSEENVIAPEGEPDSEAAARKPQDERSAREGEQTAARQDEPSQDGPTLPVNSTRSAIAGPRGCWALNSKGEPCGAARLKSGDYCLSHSGGGIAADPAGYAPLAAQASKEARAARAQMRLQLGVTRPTGPRAQLKAQAHVVAERLAGRVVSAALDDPRLALKLIESVDPAPRAEISVTGPVSVDDVERMGFSQLQALAASMGIETNPSQPALTE